MSDRNELGVPVDRLEHLSTPHFRWQKRGRSGVIGWLNQKRMQQRRDDTRDK